MLLVKFIDDIRSKAGRKALDKKAKNQSRKVETCNIKDAKSVGLLYVVNEKTDYLKVQKFAKFIKGEYGTRKVHILGYWDGKKDEPDYLQSTATFNYFTKNDLNWKGFPESGVVDNFVNEKFDIIIDLNDYYNIPLRFILLQSDARFKIGRYSEENELFFDMMFASDHDDFEAYTKVLIKYLLMIKK